MPEIEVMNLREDKIWRHYVSHPNWSIRRAQQSIERLNRQAPNSRKFRLKEQSPELSGAQEIRDFIEGMQEIDGVCTCDQCLELLAKYLKLSGFDAASKMIDQIRMRTPEPPQ